MSKNANRPPQMFQIGDSVRVVYEPYYDCPFVWVKSMTKYCGELATITDAYWIAERNTYAYRIDKDHYDHSWCENCFIVNELELGELDPDTDLDILFQ